MFIHRKILKNYKLWVLHALIFSGWAMRHASGSDLYTVTIIYSAGCY